MLADADHIVVVDSDPALRQMVIRYLEKHNVPTKSASNRIELNRHFQGRRPGLIILDLPLGQDDGLALLREIRSHSDVPIIITVGHRSDAIDRIVGLELGADGYLAKPFSPRELLALVRAVLRRQEMGRTSRAHDPQQGGYRFGGWQLDRRTRRLLDPSATPVALSKGEYALLLAFLGSPQRPLTREHLLQATRINEDIFDRSIDVQVLRLRRKLEIDPSAPRVIQTERGVGYIFALPVEPSACLFGSAEILLKQRLPIEVPRGRRPETRPGRVREQSRTTGRTLDQVQSDKPLQRQPRNGA
jgi:two-component system, OmpR family, response regulator